jgi:hypothetical protein
MCAAVLLGSIANRSPRGARNRIVSGSDGGYLHGTQADTGVQHTLSLFSRFPLETAGSRLVECAVSFSLASCLLAEPSHRRSLLRSLRSAGSARFTRFQESSLAIRRRLPHGTCQLLRGRKKANRMQYSARFACENQFELARSVPRDGKAGVNWRRPGELVSALERRLFSAARPFDAGCDRG